MLRFSISISWSMSSSNPSWTRRWNYTRLPNNSIKELRRKPYGPKRTSKWTSRLAVRWLWCQWLDTSGPSNLYYCSWCDHAGKRGRCVGWICQQIQRGIQNGQSVSICVCNTGWRGKRGKVKFLHSSMLKGRAREFIISINLTILLSIYIIKNWNKPKSTHFCQSTFGIALPTPIIGNHNFIMN